MPIPFSNLRANYITKALLAWWKFDEEQGLIAHDSSGNGIIGNLINSPIWINGKKGGALQFNGTNNYVDTNNFADNLSSMTVCCWFNTLSTQTGYGTIMVGKLAVGGWVSGAGWLLGMGGPNLGFIPAGCPVCFFQDAGGTDYMGWYSNSTFNNGNWNHVAFVINNLSSSTLYINGNNTSITALNAGGSISSYTNTSNVRIGNDYDSELFAGNIDDVRIYNRALSSSEITKIYNLQG